MMLLSITTQNNTPKVFNITITSIPIVVILLTVILLLIPSSCNNQRPIPISISQHRRRYNRTPLDPLLINHAPEFHFDRFHSASSISAALSSVRPPTSFRYHTGSDGRNGRYSSTKLGGDWVLAESHQIARNCSSLDVLSAYLDGENQKNWNADKVLDIRIRPMDTNGWYQQDMVLKPQRILTGTTGVMRYTQLIRVDQIGLGDCDYNAHVTLSEEKLAEHTTMRPFDVLCVNVNLRQVGCDVEIYAAGVMKVNRRVVPNLVVFDAAGIAGGMAGKATLWLSSHFRG